MYVCGVTVYDYCHLGHARSYIGWDVVRRYLKWQGYAVQYVQNFTDIDDKIIRRSQEENISWEEVTHKYIDAYHEDLGRLNVMPADAYPKVTEVMPEIIDLIKTLIDRGYAYPVAGDVYYAVERFPTYGKLSGRKLDQMESGASGRVDEEEARKRHPFDFALWKAAKPGEPEWESPWGKGRPGWHIECSAMVKKLLGDRIDIHTGGEDLVFPHHENEIAQSEAASAKPFASVWMHNAFVKIRGDKMSKSLKNFTTIRSLLETTDPMVVRLFVLQAHYRSPIDFTDEAIAAAENGWKVIKESLMFGNLYGSIPQLGWKEAKSIEFDDLERIDNIVVEKFRAAMDDDFNTPEGLAILFELAKSVRRERNIFFHTGVMNAESQTIEKQWYTLGHLAKHVLGLDPFIRREGVVFIQASSREATISDQSDRELSDIEIESLIQQRQNARKAKDFAEGDRIRNQLQAKGIILSDQIGGSTQWHRVNNR